MYTLYLTARLGSGWYIGALGGHGQIKFTAERLLTFIRRNPAAFNTVLVHVIKPENL